MASLCTQFFLGEVIVRGKKVSVTLMGRWVDG